MRNKYVCWIKSSSLVYFTENASNYSDDLDTDDLASFLNNWEDASSDAGLRSPSQSYAHEKLNPIIDVPVGMPSEPYSEPPPPAQPPMDIEADFTVGEERVDFILNDTNHLRTLVLL